ncbi:hypothetical protein Ancab_022561, partial [Ancistrocladus abbreviatus]
RTNNFLVLLHRLIMDLISCLLGIIVRVNPSTAGSIGPERGLSIEQGKRTLLVQLCIRGRGGWCRRFRAGKWRDVIDEKGWTPSWAWDGGDGA